MIDTTAIERALEERGISGRQASMETVGNPDMLRGLRRGRFPTADRLQALCEVLDLEFYVGPRRDREPLDERRLGLAVETAERGLAASRQRLSPGDKARFFVAVYQPIGEEHAPANAARLRQMLQMVTEAASEPGGGCWRNLRTSASRHAGGSASPRSTSPKFEAR